MEGAGVMRGEGKGYVDGVGFISGVFESLLFGTAKGCVGAGIELDRFEAGGAGGGEGDVLVLTGDQWIGGDELPVLARRVLQWKDGAGEGIEAPEAGDSAGDGGRVGGGELDGSFFGGLFRRAGFGFIGCGVRLRDRAEAACVLEREQGPGRPGRRRG